MSASPIRRHLLPGFGCFLFAGLLLGSGCVSPGGAEKPDPALVKSLARSTADQVRRCYRRPAVPTKARQIVTRLRVRFTPDGQVAALPEVLAQASITPETAPYAEKMAQAATLAVLQCAPFKLPPEAYSGGWEELEFTFSPLARG